MHVIFIPYGNREWVERTLRAIENQWYISTFRKGKKEQKVWIKGAVRQLPFGAYEAIIAREALDMVLTTLKFNEDRYGLNIKLSLLRKLWKCKKAPENFDTEKKYLWFDELSESAVNIIPIGIREDADITEPKEGQFKDWVHEGI